MKTIYIASEDDLSEVVLKRILSECGEFHVAHSFKQSGFGYLKSNVSRFDGIARNMGPVLLLTDLDTDQCPENKINLWRGGMVLSDNFIFRVAVREVEAWLLADKESIARYLSVSPDLIPPIPEELNDPKGSLLSIAKRSKLRRLREDILPVPGARVGIGYNNRLCAYVNQDWRPRLAAKNSRSLEKALARISDI